MHFLRGDLFKSVSNEPVSKKDFVSCYCCCITDFNDKAGKHRLRVTQTRAIACSDPSCNVCFKNNASIFLSMLLCCFLPCYKGISNRTNVLQPLKKFSITMYSRCCKLGPLGNIGGKRTLDF